VVGDATGIQVGLIDGRRSREGVGLTCAWTWPGQDDARGCRWRARRSNRTRVGRVRAGARHPFGLEQTVSFGIVSRKVPRSRSPRGFEFIQTTPRLNPGNSGGRSSTWRRGGGVNSMAAVNGTIGFAIPVTW